MAAVAPRIAVVAPFLAADVVGEFFGVTVRGCNELQDNSGCDNRSRNNDSESNNNERDDDAVPTDDRDHGSDDTDNDREGSGGRCDGGSFGNGSGRGGASGE